MDGGRLFSALVNKRQVWRLSCRSQYRWEDMVLSIHWLLENGNTGEEQFLWDVAELAQQQVRVKSVARLTYWYVFGSI